MSTTKESRDGEGRGGTGWPCVILQVERLREPDGRALLLYCVAVHDPAGAGGTAASRPDEPVQAGEGRRV